MRPSLLLLATAGLGVGLAAPAPKVAIPTFSVATVQGRWAMQWGGSDGTMTFAKGGGYVHQWGPTDYVGTWEVRGGRLHVTESTTPDDPTSWRYWWVDLKWDAKTKVWRGRSKGAYIASVILQRRK